MEPVNLGGHLLEIARRDVGGALFQEIGSAHEIGTAKIGMYVMLEMLEMFADPRHPLRATATYLADRLDDRGRVVSTVLGYRTGHGSQNGGGGLSGAAAGSGVQARGGIQAM
ncbi:hypothetical protein SEPCBS119000_001767 [Sporothrix epigloea]|uniref:Uncharacterized protein n=1 Tax=Sporothrix epigloea TaxID=1892477 RepID=A0ABP0DCI7_9PEZI